MAWVWPVFLVLLIPLIIVLFIVYFKGKKLFRLCYISSVFTYAMLIMYLIDAYDLRRNSIILLLAFSSLLMIGLGVWMRKRHVE